MREQLRPTIVLLLICLAMTFALVLVNEATVDVIAARAAVPLPNVSRSARPTSSPSLSPPTGSHSSLTAPSRPPIWRRRTALRSAMSTM